MPTQSVTADLLARIAELAASHRRRPPATTKPGRRIQATHAARRDPEHVAQAILDEARLGRPSARAMVRPTLTTATRKA